MHATAAAIIGVAPASFEQSWNFLDKKSMRYQDVEFKLAWFRQKYQLIFN